MISKYSHKGLNWVDLESPSTEEISHIVELHSIPSYIHEEIKANTNENKIETKDDYMFIILNIPKTTNDLGVGNKIIFVINDNFVLTIHDHPIHAFNKFGKEMELDLIVEENSKIKNNNLLFAYLLKNLYLHSEIQLVASNNEVNNFKKQILQNKKRLKLFTFLTIILLITTIIFYVLRNI